jgi:hypothetical protein
MVTRKKLGLLATCVMLFAGAPATHAQWAVIDVGAIAQLSSRSPPCISN